MTLRSSSTMPTYLSLIYALWLQKSESLPAGTMYWSRAFLGMSRVRVTPFFGLRLEQAAPQKAPPPITSFGSDQ